MANLQDTQEDHHQVLSVTQARGARRGRHMAWVLGISMALIVIGFAALYLFHLPHLNTSGSQSAITSQQQANGFQTPPPQPRQSENPQTTPSITPGIGSDGKAL